MQTWGASGSCRYDAGTSPRSAPRAQYAQAPSGVVPSKSSVSPALTLSSPGRVAAKENLASRFGGSPNAPRLGGAGRGAGLGIAAEALVGGEGKGAAFTKESKGLLLLVVVVTTAAAASTTPVARATRSGTGGPALLLRPDDGSGLGAGAVYDAAEGKEEDKGRDWAGKAAGWAGRATVAD
jgi:hypothetical protein